MRIVGGVYRGRALRAPEGQATRPTSDRARESLFNILEHAPWSRGVAGARVLDLFAGSGALGLEALSRGADFALFVETDAAARGAIRDNIETLGVFGATRVHRRDATDLGQKPAGLGAPFSLVFLDPPYGQGLAQTALTRLTLGGWIAPDALIVAEQGAAETLEAPGFTEHDARIYGAALLRFLSPSA